MSDQSGVEFYPYFLEERGPRLRDSTYLPVEALPIHLDGTLVGWFWWNDDDIAGGAEPITGSGRENDTRFRAERWTESLSRRVAEGALPSVAVSEIRSHGVDSEPPHRGESGGIPADAQPIRLPYRHLLARAGSPGPHHGPLDDDLVFDLAGPKFAARVGDDVPVSYVAWEKDGEVVGWLWWNDAQKASWHVPNYFAPGARLADGTTPVFNHPWASAMKSAHDAGLTPSETVRRLLSDDEDEHGHRIPVQTPQRARSFAHLREIAGESDYLAARGDFARRDEEVASARRAQETQYFRAHPGEAEAPVVKARFAFLPWRRNRRR